MKDLTYILKKYNQEHLLNYLNKVEDEKKEDILKQIEKIDFEQLESLYKISKRKNNKAIEGVIIEHIPFVDKYKMEEDKSKLLKELGENVIRSNKYAVLTMAGGQGTRLGHDGPKGTFKL